jgi:hypothetical protein
MDVALATSPPSRSSKRRCTNAEGEACQANALLSTTQRWEKSVLSCVLSIALIPDLNWLQAAPIRVQSWHVAAHLRSAGTFFLHPIAARTNTGRGRQ